MQFEVESPHSLRQFCPEPLGIRFSLESNDDVVCKSHDDDVTVSLFSAPRLNPQVEDVVVEWCFEVNMTKCGESKQKRRRSNPEQQIPPA